MPPAQSAAKARHRQRRTAAPVDWHKLGAGLLHNPDGIPLAPFFAALWQSEVQARAGKSGGLTRITHMGDSSIGGDQLPHMLRRRMQRRFGDGGPGFILMQPHSLDYRHSLVMPQAKAPWDFCFIIYRCKSDGRYGLGGATFRADGQSHSVFRTPRKAGALGSRVSRAELYFAAQPGGGRIELRVDRDAPTLLSTAAEALEDRVHPLDLTPGPHTLHVRAKGGGPVRTYGVVLENEGPGVVWDGLSMIGAFTHKLLAQSSNHIRSQLAFRAPHLLVLSYGGNDLRRLKGGKVDRSGFTDELDRVLTHLTGPLVSQRDAQGRPKAACLITAINDHRKSGHYAISHREVETIVAVQKQMALKHGCAFFDTYQAMGGRGALERWLSRRPPLAAADQKHLSRAGRRVIADAFYNDLMAHYGTWKRTQLAAWRARQ